MKKSKTEEKYSVVMHKFIGYSETGLATYEITFNKSLEHTGRFKEIEAGLNACCKNELKTDILLRILYLIPFVLFAFFGAFFLFFQWIINFIRFGGEAIAYTRKTSRKTIADVFNKINEKL